MGAPTNGNGQGQLIEASTVAAQKKLNEANADNQRFLLNFITGNYLGPDLINDATKQPILQRIVEGLPAYAPADLGTSVLTLKDMECLYGYILKDAPPSAVVKEHYLQQYFNNKLYMPNGIDEMRQFHFFFPTDRHTQERRGRNSKVFKGIVIIHNPDISHIQPDALQRFKSLTGRTEVEISMEDFQVYCKGKMEEREEKKLKRRQESAKNGPSGKKARLMEAIQAQPLSQVPLSLCYPGFPNGTEAGVVNDKSGPSTMMLICTSQVESDNSELSVVYSGTLQEARVGPPVGIVDIGDSNTAYIFRVSLPGVDTSKVTCEVERSGKVIVEGFTQTGENAVFRGLHLFHMKTKNMPPKGKFNVSFDLPGRVENRSWLCDISNGILEAIVSKEDGNTSRNTLDQ